VRKLGFLLVLASLSLLAACGSSGGGSNTSSTVTSVSVSCSPSTVSSGQTSQCSATVTGTGNFSSAVTWTANNNATISSTGLLTAPTVSSATTVTVTATSTQDATKSGTASVTVNPMGSITAVSVSCLPSTVSSGQTSQCSATVTGTGSFSSSVTWSATAGSISASGVLTAPIVSSPTTVTVTATSTQDATKSGTASVTVNPITAGANVAFVTVTVCVPGSTTQCQTIDHVQVDTGSSGLRIISSVLTISLPPENDSGGNPLDECLVFADGFVWGPVATADITVAGETASAVPVQIMIPASSLPPVPPTCSSQNPTGGSGNEGGSVDAFGANALIGVGLFQQDCGPYCVTNSTNPYFYYGCTSSGCTPTTATLAQQVPNPAALFATDNNGVLVQLESVPDGGLATANGFLIFGIGTQSNNGLGGATVYPVPDSGNNAGDFITTFTGSSGVPESYPQSFVDSGSNGYFFLDSATTGIPTCSGQLSAWYCPTTSPDNLTASNQGQSVSGPLGSQISVSFSIENTNNLFSGSNSAFSTLGGVNSSAFDWGLSFFYGRNVFTAIENMSTPGGTGPYFAY